MLHKVFWLKLYGGMWYLTHADGMQVEFVHVLLVSLYRPVRVRGHVDEWLGRLEQTMRDTVEE